MKHKQFLNFLFSAPLMIVLLSTHSARADAFTYTGTIQTYLVSATGTYNMFVYGAEGGAGSSYPNSSYGGGLGAEVGGSINLIAGEVLTIAVGGAGQNAEAAGGGGGGTFVVGPGGTLLAVAGGGGGGGTDNPGLNALTGTSGAGGGLSGGAGGMTGSGGQGNDGGGGAGFSGAGGNGLNGAGGSDYAQGLAGGDGIGGSGGFGGGGAGGYVSGGGGGGFSGGGAGHNSFPSGGGGGGGSYLNPAFTKTILLSGISTVDGNGYATITQTSTPTAVTPEPASLLLLGTSLLGLTAALRHRREV